MGSYLTIVNDTSDTYSIKIGPDTAALNIAGIIFSIVGVGFGLGGITGVIVGNVIKIGIGISIAAAITSFSGALHQNLEKSGYTTLRPGEKKRFGKMSLSLWQQCHCVRVRQEGNYMICEDFNMRPIFSGATDSSNLDHCIEYWYKKHGPSLVAKYEIKNDKEKEKI